MKSLFYLFLVALFIGGTGLGISYAVQCHNENKRQGFIKSISHRDGKKHSAATVRRWQQWNQEQLAKFEIPCSQQIEAEGFNSFLPRLDGDSLLAGVDVASIRPAGRPEVETQMLVAMIEEEPIDGAGTSRSYEGSTGSGITNWAYLGLSPWRGPSSSSVGLPVVTPVAPLTPTPEPSSLVLLGSGVIGIAVGMRKVASK